MSDPKKKFRDTKLGQFLKEKVPGVLDVVDDYFPPAKVLSALVGQNLPADDKSEFDKLLNDHEREMFALEVQDRESARQYKSDWMMKLVGLWVMALSTYVVYTIFNGHIDASEIAHLIAGEIIGFAASVVMLYYGASYSRKFK